jgi:hypothetical protein
MRIQAYYNGNNAWNVNFSDFRLFSQNSSFSPQVYGMPQKGVLLTRCQQTQVNLSFELSSGQVPSRLQYQDSLANVNVASVLPSSASWLYVVRGAWVTIQGQSDSGISWQATVVNGSGYYHVGDAIAVKLSLQHNTSQIINSQSVAVTSIANDQGLILSGPEPSLPVGIAGSGITNIVIRTVIPPDGFSGDIHLVITVSS